MSKPLLDVLAGYRRQPPPVWLMRQAGRYLPEYRTVREKAKDFLALCFTPDLAIEVTLQPIRRFRLDAAILFSDILVVPHALGQRVWFTEHAGPRLDPVCSRVEMDRLSSELDQDRLEPVYQTIAGVKARLPPDIALLGFCGAPWTVASYMIAGQGTAGQEPARLVAYRDPPMLAELIDRLVDASTSYLVHQLQAGVDAVQIFDSWAGTVAGQHVHQWCIEPVRRIVAGVRKEIPDARIIGFPRGIGGSITCYANEVAVDAIGLDWTVDLSIARRQIQPQIAVQGNLDPVALVAGGNALDSAVDAILQTLSDRPFIFNLGHGILPETPIAHVEQMLKRVRGC